MATKIGELISGKSEQATVDIDGVSIPVAVLRNLSGEGYENLRIYKDNNTFSLWGKTLSACFTLEQFLEKGKSK
ncbi:MAG: hypothetical protein JW836_10115 [Deltaproteobacteria bacterium]|nr:hypothetical protein [Deltaproteobacteria bacterium]